MQIEIEAGLIGIQELAKKLAISSRSVWRIIARGELSVTRIGRLTLIARAEVTKWLADQQAVTPGDNVSNAARQFAPR